MIPRIILVAVLFYTVFYFLQSNNFSNVAVSIFFPNVNASLFIWFGSLVILFVFLLPFLVVSFDIKENREEKRPLSYFLLFPSSSSYINHI